ncbi:MAG: DoxX family protein [Bacteroidota bacterium]
MWKIRQLYDEAKGNRWLRYFAIFCRVALALGFVPSGIVKIMGERFTALPDNHPLGHYLEALHHTGYYYTFIGITQLTIAVLLFIPRTALLGAILYFPIIVNICILAYATRFEGTRITTLMVMANIFLLSWDYDRLKHILPFKQPDVVTVTKNNVTSNKFPFAFFGFVIAAAATVIVVNAFLYDIRPGNMKLECTNSCANNRNPKACYEFCDCIYDNGGGLEKCLEEYERAK